MRYEPYHFCKICHTRVIMTENGTCPQCNNPIGSVRCNCGAIIDGHDAFCRSCGEDRRWTSYTCPHCNTSFTALKSHLAKDRVGYYNVTCPNCTNHFVRPELHIDVEY